MHRAPQFPAPAPRPRPETGTAPWAPLGALAVLAALLAIWTAAAAFYSTPFIVPTPAAAFAALGTMPDLASRLVVTLGAAAIGFAVALAVGGVLGAALAARGSTRAGAAALLGLPLAAFAPAVVLWEGLGSVTMTVCAALLAAAPVLGGFLAGGAARALGIATGTSMAINGALLGEFLAGDRGLGHQLVMALATMRTDLQFACLFVLIVTGVIVAALAHMLASAAFRHGEAS